jgi:hypothetical protein
VRQLKLPAVFMRGGTSNAIVFKTNDLPADRALWPEIFRAAMASPDPFGRQLNEMGSGISSLSKICVVGPSSRADADIDYAFAQIGVRIDIQRGHVSGMYPTSRTESLLGDVVGLGDYYAVRHDSDLSTATTGLPSQARLLTVRPGRSHQPPGRR